MIDKMSEAHVEVLETLEALSTQKHVREIETREKDANLQNRAQLIQTATALLPALANRVLGKKIIPETADTLQQQVVQFMASLSPGDIERMFNSIESPIAKAGFGELLNLVTQSSVADGEPGQSGNALVTTGGPQH
jgi:hypothetical protein